MWSVTRPNHTRFRPLTAAPQWGAADADIKVLSVENTELEGFLLKAGVGQYIAIYMIPVLPGISG